jgi:hypothetical protein
MTLVAKNLAQCMPTTPFHPDPHAIIMRSVHVGSFMHPIMRQVFATNAVSTPHARATDVDSAVVSVAGAHATRTAHSRAHTESARTERARTLPTRPLRPATRCTPCSLTTILQTACAAGWE